MGINLGSFMGGAAKGISQGIQDNAAREDAEWKKKERDRLEADQKIDDSVNAATAEHVSGKNSLDWGAFGAAARGENVGEFISKRDDAEWKKKERARIEADKKLDDDVDKQTRDYALSRVAIVPDGGKDVQGSPAATTQSAPVMRNPAADGIARNPGGTEPPQQDISERPDIGLAASSPTANAVRSGVNIRKAQQPQANATQDNSETPAQPKYRKPNVDDMIDVAQHRAQLYLKAGKYEKATATHKDYLAFAAEKIQNEERDRTEDARKVAGNVMLGDFSGIESFYNTRVPDGNKLGNIVENPDGSITAHTIDRNGNALTPITFQDRNRLASTISALSNSGTLLKHLEGQAKLDVDAGKVKADASKDKFDQDYKNRDLIERGRHNKSVEDIYRNKPQLTTPQQRINQEIQAARNAIIGMSPEAIRNRTQQYSATGRENKDYDPLLAAKVKQANRRKFGEDDGFPIDQSEETDSGNVVGKFSADQAMKGMRLGKPTDRGHEVFDANGKLIGHYN